MKDDLLNNLITNLISCTKTEFSKHEYFSECLNLLEINIQVPPSLPVLKHNDYYFQQIISHIENLLTEEQLTYFHNELPFSLIKFINDDTKKKSKIKETFISSYSTNDLEFSTYFIETISSIHDDNYKLHIYNKYKERIDEYDTIFLICSLESDDLKIPFIKEYLDDEEYISSLISSLSNDDTKLKYLETYKENLSTEYINKIIASFNSDDIKMSFLDTYEKIPNIVIRSLKDSHNIQKYFPRLNIDTKGSLLKLINDEEIKISLIKELIEKKYKYSLCKEIASLSNDSDKIYLLEIYHPKNPYDIIISLKDPNNIIESFKKFGTANTSLLMRRTKKIDSQFIIDNIELFLSKELNDQDKIPKYKDIISRMYKINNDIVHTLHFSFLDDKYLITLGEDKINVIASFENIELDVLKLSNKEYEAFYRVLNYYSENNSQLDWTYVANQLLGEFHFKGSEKLINNITDFSSINLVYLTCILLDGNPMSIETVEQLNNYPNIIKNECDKQIQSNNIYEKINAIMIKLCGIGKDTNMLRGFTELMRHNTWQLTNLFGQDIHLLEDSPYKELIIRLKEIQATTDPEELNQIYNSITEFHHIDIYKVETYLKKSYLKLYNDCLLQIDKLPKNSEGLLEAGTNFNIITTSIGAYVSNSPDNYQEDWNRPSLASGHFCTNFIREDMIGTAPIPHISYGFTNMDPDSLMLSGANDIYSSGASFISKAYNDEKYLSPDSQINETYKSGKYGYNEMDFRRYQNGKRKLPDYILVFRKDGIIPNLEEAKKASQDWNNLPIVVVDIDLCLKDQYQKLQNMLKEYQINPSLPLLEAIKTKILNNRVTDKSFASNINIEDILSEIENYSKEDSPKLT